MMNKPKIIPRARHNISRQNISANALKVLYRLKRSNFDAYLVGGGVRDLLLSRKPKDFDVVTNARPKQIKKVFRNSRIIGRRFKLVHVYFENEIIEVSTFRGNIDEPKKSSNTNTYNKSNTRDDHIATNVYGTIEEDVYRRDITINALYYNIQDFSIVDYVNGIQDIEEKNVRIIGKPQERFWEDPIRILRTIRLSEKLGFNVAAEIKPYLTEMRLLLLSVPSARLLDEIVKLFFFGAAYSTYQALEKYDILSTIFPGCSKKTTQKFRNFLKTALKTMDKRFFQEKTLTPAFLLAVFLWLPFQLRFNTLRKKHTISTALHQSIRQVLDEQKSIFPIPKRFKQMICQIWVLQFKFEQHDKKKTGKIKKQRYFKAALDFLIIRTHKTPSLKTVLSHWEH
jgi:poly(A) polymerase